MIAGEFERGKHRGGGKFVNAIQRDRVRALQLMNQALKLTARESARSEVANFYLEFAHFFVKFIEPKIAACKAREEQQRQQFILH